MESIIALQAMDDSNENYPSPIHGETSNISVFSDCSSAVNCTVSEMCSAYCY